MKIIRKRKRLLVILLAVTMIMTMLPLTSMSADTQNPEKAESLEELDFSDLPDTDDDTAFETTDDVDTEDANEDDLIEDMDLTDIPDVVTDSILNDANENTITKFTPFGLIPRLLTVTNGTPASTTHNLGDEVTITADEPEGGKTFDKWISDDIVIATPTNEIYTFTMPDKDVTITATYKDDLDEKNTTMNSVKVRVFSENKDKWEYRNLTPGFNSETREYNFNLDTASYELVEFSFIKQNNEQSVRATMEGTPHYLNDDDLSFTTKPYRFTKAISEFIFTVTAKDGITTDTYRITVKRGSLTPRNLTVINGSSNISNPMLGDKVTVTADDPPAGKVFDRWVRDDLPPIYETNTSYTFFMPNWDVKTTAIYKQEPESPETDTSLRYLTMLMLGKTSDGFEVKVPMEPRFDPQIRKYTVYITPKIQRLRDQGYTLTKNVDEQDLEVYVDGVIFDMNKNIPITKDETVVKYKVISKDRSTFGTYEITFIRTKKPIIYYDTIRDEGILPNATIGKEYKYKFLAERTPDIRCLSSKLSHLISIALKIIRAPDPDLPLTCSL